MVWGLVVLYAKEIPRSAVVKGAGRLTGGYSTMGYVATPVPVDPNPGEPGSKVIHCVA